MNVKFIQRQNVIWLEFLCRPSILRSIIISTSVFFLRTFQFFSLFSFTHSHSEIYKLIDSYLLNNNFKWCNNWKVICLKRHLRFANRFFLLLHSSYFVTALDIWSHVLNHFIWPHSDIIIALVMNHIESFGSSYVEHLIAKC